jgi:hypothetical protein
MKKMICYLFHERSRTPWVEVDGGNYISTCHKCRRNRFTKSPVLSELNRAAAVAAICVAVLVIIGYFLKYK